MLKLIKSCIKFKYYKKHHFCFKDELLIEILNNFKNKINKEILKVRINDREDIYQEIYMKIEKIILNFEIKKHEINKRILIDNNTSYYKYMLYINQLELCKYINKSIENLVIDYKRKIYKKIVLKENNHANNYYHNKVRFLKELINNINDENYKTRKMISFLKLFIQDDNYVTEKEVAIKLGVSQQAINKRKNRYINKLLKK